MKRYFIKLSRIIYKAIGIFSPLFRVFILHSDLESLERKGKYSEARKIRHKAIKELNKKYLSSLWRQEGFDLLYQIKDYPKSLSAFENAMETLELNTALYGVANPLDIYFGASIAAISANKKIKAQKYYTEFKTLFAQYSENPKLVNTLNNHKEGMKWIESNIT